MIILECTPERQPQLPCWPIYNFNLQKVARKVYVWALRGPVSYIQCEFMCIGVYVFASTYCCTCTKAGGKENMGGVGIQCDVLHIPVVNSQ